MPTDPADNIESALSPNPLGCRISSIDDDPELVLLRCSMSLADQPTGSPREPLSDTIRPFFAAEESFGFVKTRERADDPSEVGREPSSVFGRRRLRKDMIEKMRGLVKN